MSFYGAYAPNLWFDGSVNGGWSYDDWPDDLSARENVSTEVTLDISAVLEGSEFDVSVTVCVETGGAEKDLRVYFVQVLDHFPETEPYYRNTFRQVSTEDLVIAAGACVGAQKSMTLKDTDLAKLSDVGIVVWVQEPLDVAPAEVFQAAHLFPFVMIDGFENGDVSGWD